VELLKDALIVLLSCSAVFLAARSALFRDFPLLPSRPNVQGESRPTEEAVRPCQMAVRSQWGLYGVGYDAAQVGRGFDRFGSLLGEGLSTAREPEAISADRWQALLERPGVYCAFQGRPPLGVLCAWLGGSGCALSGEAEGLLLAWEGGSVRLAWRSGEEFWEAGTQVAWESHLQTAVEEFNPNGAAFVYMLKDTDSAYVRADPYVLVSPGAIQPQVYAAASPDLAADNEALSRLLSALGFQGGAAYEVPDGLSINEGNDRLRVGRGGAVSYFGGEEGRFTVPAQGETPTAQEAAAAAWSLLNRAAAEWKGEEDLVLTAVTPTAEGWTVEFQYQLNATPALVGESGLAARFTVKGRQISGFTLTLRSYTATGETSVLPRERLAAAALNALPGAGDRLLLCYSDTGLDTVTAGWMAQTLA